MSSRLTIVALFCNGGAHELPSLDAALRLNGQVKTICVHPNAETLNKSDQSAIEALVEHFGEGRVVVMERIKGKHIERGRHVVCGEGKSRSGHF